MLQVVKGIILGSSSPFRRHLLETTGLKFSVEVPLCDEQSVESSNPRELALLRAVFKAQDVACRNREHLVLSCDQTLDLHGKVFQKVDSVAQARETLRSLSGQCHSLHSAFALFLGECRLASEVVTCKMNMRELRSEELEAYLKTGEWRGSVGCYKFEEKGRQLFERVTAEQSAIVGLPLVEMLASLRSLGVNPLLQPSGPWYILSRNV